jgi:23S rRNA pseudouridine1911/1915/1917 synthase
MARARKLGETRGRAADGRTRKDAAAPEADVDRDRQPPSAAARSLEVEPDGFEDADDEVLAIAEAAVPDDGAAPADAARTVEAVVAEAETRGRLDVALAAASGLSRARVQALVKAGHATVDGRIVEDSSLRLVPGARLCLDIPAPADATPTPEAIPLVIVYEDAELVVVDKPAGLVVHPAPGNATGTLVNALLHHCRGQLSGIGGVRRPGIVHRLDKDTSGLLVVAKTNRAHQSLAAQFADHGRTGALERRYLAIVWGVPSAAAGTVDAALARDPRNPMRRAVGRGATAKHAVTHWRLLERFAGADGTPIASLVECRLETGRTHQVRVHMAHLGHPLLGDADYGAGYRTKSGKLAEPARSLVAALDRQALHAAGLTITHPVAETVLSFESPLPPDLAAVAEALRKPRV